MKSILSPSVNKFKSRKEWENYVWSILVRETAKTNSVKEIEKIFAMLLTAHEKKQMIKRASIISLLKQGKSYRKVGKILWLSPNTISSMRKSLRKKEGYVSRHSRRKKLEKKQKPLTKKELEQIMFSIWVESLFTLPPPPIRHPRLMSQLGYKYFQKQK